MALLQISFSHKLNASLQINDIAWVCNVGPGNIQSGQLDKLGIINDIQGSVLTVDINEGGSTILSTKLTIDASEKTSTTAATAAVISDASLADDALMTIDIDGVGSGTAGAGLKVTLIGYQTTPT